MGSVFYAHPGNLRQINSATKYPSIPTLHVLEGKGVPSGPLQALWGDDEELIVTEKLDGTNVRIIMLPGGRWFIGSREELLTFDGDLVANASLGIVDAVRGAAESIAKVFNASADQEVVTFHVELFGIKSTAAWKNYGNGDPLIRLFDVSRVPVADVDRPVEQIALWRDNGGQEFANEEALGQWSRFLGLELAPRMGQASARDFKASAWTPKETWEFLSCYRAWSEDEDSVHVGKSEGLVLRNRTRSKIVKVRFEDYRKVK